VAQQWADLPLFRNVYTTGRDAAVAAAHRLVQVLAEVAGHGRLDDTSAPDFERVRPHLAQTVTVRNQSGATLQQLLELSTPVIKLWDRVVAVPLIGTLDSARTQVVMETLLQAIVDQNADMAILDITGVPMVDTVVAQYLLKTAMAVRLMGAECVISGIRPQIAQTIVQLGIDLGDISTRATLADALGWALEKAGVSVVVGQG
jgi:anti-anti-sigma regulatory factor